MSPLKKLKEKKIMEKVKIIIRDFMSLHPSRLGNIAHFEHCVKQHTHKANHIHKNYVLLYQEDDTYYVIDKDLLMSLLILCLL